MFDRGATPTGGQKHYNADSAILNAGHCGIVIVSWKLSYEQTKTRVWVCRSRVRVADHDHGHHHKCSLYHIVCVSMPSTCFPVSLPASDLKEVLTLTPFLDGTASVS